VPARKAGLEVLQKQANVDARRSPPSLLFGGIVVLELRAAAPMSRAWSASTAALDAQPADAKSIKGKVLGAPWRDRSGRAARRGRRVREGMEDAKVDWHSFLCGAVHTFTNWNLPTTGMPAAYNEKPTSGPGSP